MKKPRLLYKIHMLAFCTLPLSIGILNVTHAQALMPNAHLIQDQYKSDFDNPIIDFSTQLPWKERFTPSAAFDKRYSLSAPNMVAVAVTSKTEATATSNGSHDASGVIKDIRLSSGKLKIQHGPIDRLGMPGMTMMFKVSDPALLENLQKGEKIQFNLDNTDGGFTVTKITREAN